MKINGSFILRCIAGDNILIPVGETAVSLNGMVALNDTAALIWQGIRDGKAEEEILTQLMEEYAVDLNQASADYNRFVANMVDAGLLLPEE